jgi:hypothetical protein
MKQAIAKALVEFPSLFIKGANSSVVGNGTEVHKAKDVLRYYVLAKPEDDKIFSGHNCV